MRHLNSLRSLIKTALLVALIFLMTLQIECNLSVGKDRPKSNSTEVEMIQKFRNRLNQGNLEDINFTYRVSGGMPAEGRIEREIKISGSDHFVTVRNREGNAPPQVASGEIEATAFQNLLQKVEQNLESLIPRSEAQFVPDSVVGSISIEIDGEQETFYFLVEEEQQLEGDSEGVLISPGMAETIDAFSRLSHQILERN